MNADETNTPAQPAPTSTPSTDGKSKIPIHPCEGKPRPKSNPGISKLPAPEYNQCLRETFDFFHRRIVKLKDGRTGVVLGVDPRPVQGGADGNFLMVRVERAAIPGRTAHENAYALPDDVEIVGYSALPHSSPKERRPPVKE